MILSLSLIKHLDRSTSPKPVALAMAVFGGCLYTAVKKSSKMFVSITYNKKLITIYGIDFIRQVEFILCKSLKLTLSYHPLIQKGDDEMAYTKSFLIAKGNNIQKTHCKKFEYDSKIVSKFNVSTFLLLFFAGSRWVELSRTDIAQTSTSFSNHQFTYIHV